jgi:Na+/H+-translocating membrane pyrophosphatase
MALLAAYVVELPLYDKALKGVTSIKGIVDHYNLTLLNPLLLGGLFLGAMLVFAFCGMTLRAVGRSAGRMVEETRRQFRKLREKLMADGMSEAEAADPDNWPESVEVSGEKIPNYAHCVEIATAGAQKEMIVPSLLAIAAPVAVGVVLGVPGVIGLLAGANVVGLSMACMLNNGGGTWDNAKKWIEKGNLGGKGSAAHKAGVIGDTVGDPCKDTSGPSLNILIKLMAMVSVAFAGLVVELSPAVQRVLHLGGS